ncbi:MAG: glycine/betaine ABC transporter substrate-binding protein [Actinomycetota bacterium]|nr:glycine/betaine ABC transporter substrate-binding protein [Actinomycetota bacterium]
MKTRTNLRANARASVRAAMLVALVLALAAALSGCGNAGGGGQSSDGGDGPSVTVGSKNFTEQFVLGELYAQTLEANGFTVERQLNLGSEQIADGALQDGQIDFYPEYTGTALTTLLGYEGENPPSPEETYEEARSRYAERDPAATMLQYADFNNNYGIFVRREIAEEQGLETLDDLAGAASGLTFATFSEFQERPDGYPNMVENYPGLDSFGDTITANDLGLRYQGVENGEADVGVGFLTDGQLTSPTLTILTDEKAIWPFYYPAPVVRDEVLEENPEMEGILNSVTERLNVDVIRELNGRVDIEQEDPEDVAEEFLREQGLI